MCDHLNEHGSCVGCTACNEPKTETFECVCGQIVEELHECSHCAAKVCSNCIENATAEYGTIDTCYTCADKENFDIKQALNKFTNELFENSNSLIGRAVVTDKDGVKWEELEYKSGLKVRINRREVA